MAKKNKAPKLAAQTVKKTEPKVAEQAAVAETKPEPKTETKTEPTKLTVVKDTRTKDEKRRDRLALREKALTEALEQDLPFNEKHPAMAFEQNYQQAFQDATTSPNAIPAAAIKAAKAEIAASIAKSANEGRIGERIIAKANDVPAIAEAIKHFNSQIAEGVEEVKPLVEGTIITEQKDEPATTATAKEPAAEGTTTDDTVVEAATAGEDAPVETASTEAEVSATELKNEFDENGKLIRWPNESSKAYGRRKHEAKLSGAWKKPDGITVKVKPIDGGVEIDETRNGEPPETKRYPTGDLVYHSDHDGQSVSLPATNDNDEIKVDDDLVKNGSFAATVETETSDATQDVPETQTDQPEEVQEPVQTEPVSTPVEPVPSEAKTDKKTNVVSINNIPQGVEAKKFYGSAWNDERAKLLAEAYRWLCKAVDAEANGNTTTLATMMKAALRKEADAFALGTVQAKAA